MDEPERSTAASRSVPSDEQVGALLAELDREIERHQRCDASEVGEELADRLQALARALVDTPESADALDGIDVLLEALSLDLDERTLAVLSRGLFAAAEHRPAALGASIDEIEPLLAVDHSTVQAWAAATIGRVAAARPDAAATVAEHLRPLLDHESETVQHNALEALATLAQQRPDAVAPASDRLRTLLDHEDTAIQHNAVGTLGALAETHPEAVRPAIDQITSLRTHESPAVRDLAAATLVRQARQREE